jgi:hypothetical protein
LSSLSRFPYIFSLSLSLFLSHVSLFLLALPLALLLLICAPPGLRRLIQIKNKELRQMKSLAATILSQRSEVEQFFLEALHEVRTIFEPRCLIDWLIDWGLGCNKCLGCNKL